jgi:hypothetical protein
MCDGEKSVQGGAGAANQLLRGMFVAVNRAILIDSACRSKYVASSSKQSIETISNRHKNASGVRQRSASGAPQQTASMTLEKNASGIRSWA